MNNKDKKKKPRTTDGSVDAAVYYDYSSDTSSGHCHDTSSSHDSNSCYGSGDSDSNSAD